MLEQIIGKKSEYFDEEQLNELLSSPRHVHVDLGTGDGMYVVRMAKKKPEHMFIGVDADRSQLSIGSAKAAKKPAKGGCDNAMFFCMNVLNMPSFFKDFASYININYPWGSLLNAVAEPDENMLEQIAALAKNKAIFEMVLNLQVFNDPTQRENMNLPEFNMKFVEETLLPIYEKHGFSPIRYQFYKPGQDAGIPSTWGGQLTRNSKRPTFYLKCEVQR